MDFISQIRRKFTNLLLIIIFILSNIDLFQAEITLIGKFLHYTLTFNKIFQHQFINSLYTSQLIGQYIILTKTSNPVKKSPSIIDSFPVACGLSENSTIIRFFFCPRPLSLSQVISCNNHQSSIPKTIVRVYFV